MIGSGTLSDMTAIQPITVPPLPTLTRGTIVEFEVVVTGVEQPNLTTVADATISFDGSDVTASFEIPTEQVIVPELAFSEPTGKVDFTIVSVTRVDPTTWRFVCNAIAQ